MNPTIWSNHAFQYNQYTNILTIFFHQSVFSVLHIYTYLVYTHLGVSGGPERELKKHEKYLYRLGI